MENSKNSSSHETDADVLSNSEFDSSSFQTAEVTDPFHTYGENDLQCPLCFQYFKGKRLMYQHMNVHSGEKAHRCTECLMSFVRPSCLERHMRTHTGEKPFHCLECNRSFAQLSTYKRHMLSPRLHGTNTGKNRSRSENFTVSDRHSKQDGVDVKDEESSLERQTDTGIKPFPFHCLLCRRSFEHLSRYKRHMQSRRHRRKEQLTGATSFDTLMTPTDGGGKPEKKNQSAGNFSVFVTRDIGVTADEEKPTVTAEKAHRCLECGQSFSRQSELEDHVVAHEIERPFKCQICGRRFKIIGALHDHEKTHLGVKRYRCQQCQKSFTRGNGLRRHELTHGETRVKPYKCQQCQKCFTRRDELRRHALKHCGDRRFECVECSRKFFQLVQLKRHTQTHVGLKPFACNECRERFPNLYKLELHMTSAHAVGPILGVIKTEPLDDDSAADTEYSIGHNQANTGKKRNRNNKKNHRKLSDSSPTCTFKPYLCVECDRDFSQLENFERHVLTHSQPIFRGLYVCQECCRRFSNATALLKHTVIEHADC